MTLDVTLPQHQWLFKIWPVFKCETSYELVGEGESVKFPLLKHPVLLRASADDLYKNSCTTWLLVLPISVLYLDSTMSQSSQP